MQTEKTGVFVIIERGIANGCGSDCLRVVVPNLIARAVLAELERRIFDIDISELLYACNVTVPALTEIK